MRPVSAAIDCLSQEQVASAEAARTGLTHCRLKSLALSYRGSSHSRLFPRSHRGGQYMGHHSNILKLFKLPVLKKSYQINVTRGDNTALFSTEQCDMIFITKTGQDYDFCRISLAASILLVAWLRKAARHYAASSHPIQELTGMLTDCSFLASFEHLK